MVTRTGWRLTPEPWLTGVLGVDSGRLELVAGGAPLDEVLAEAWAFTGVKLPVGEAAALRELTRAGFALVGTQVVLAADLGELAPSSDDLGKPRPASPEDLPWLVELLPGAFPEARFEQDPRLDPNRVRELRRAWARQCLEGDWPVEAWVLEDHAGRVAFLSVRVDAPPEARTDLLVVEVRGRGRAVGPHLLAHAGAELAPRFQTLLYPTQLANAGAIRMCERLGLRFQEASHVLHHHRGGAEP